MKKITWAKMIELSHLNLDPFKVTFTLEDPIDEEGDIAFGMYAVLSFTCPGRLPVVKCAGEKCANISADTVWCSID